MLKSKVAFLMSAERLEELGRLYFWTFTFREVLEWKVARKRWNSFLTNLKKKLPKWSGVRVIEAHPGNHNSPDGYCHGIHFHVLTNEWFNVNVVRRQAVACGFGKRLQVERANYGSAKYLAKYLSKKRVSGLKGWRLWQCFGGFKGTKVANLIVDSLRARCWRYAADNWEGFYKLSFGEKDFWIRRFEFWVISEGKDIQVCPETGHHYLEGMGYATPGEWERVTSRFYDPMDLFSEVLRIPKHQERKVDKLQRMDNKGRETWN